MQHMQEKLQFKAVLLDNVTISDHKFKHIPLYELGGKILQSFFNEYQDSLPKGEVYVVFGIFMVFLSY